MFNILFMFSIAIPKIIRRNSVSLSPVSSLVQSYHESPKDYYKKMNLKKEDQNYTHEK